MLKKCVLKRIQSRYRRATIPSSARIRTASAAGVRGRTLIVNFPGAPKSIAETGPAIGAALRHAVDLLAED